MAVKRFIILVTFHQVGGDMLKNDFARNVHLRRTYLGLNMVQLGNLSGVGKSTISYLEKMEEKSNPTLDKVEAIAKALKLPPWYMLISNSEFRPDHAHQLYDLCEKYHKLNNSNRDKVLSYINDMLELQNNKS